ncbi:nucleotide kinase domain-containing protein [Flavobacterium chungangensis]|uniref:Nucleotide kinase domain-containing protein n=1 Tax=Flavobacterium chungangensis TaxID=2708132 RepID=A0ABV8ZD42_9FLAO
MEILVKKNKPKKSIVLDTYWKFACERQNVFFNKMINNHQILTNDEILKKHKFTNAFRASDRVSQYLIRNVIYRQKDQNESDLLLKILLFKIFNKIETWELLISEFGDISSSSFNFNEINSVLLEAMKLKESIYSGAYIMASGKSIFGFERKHENHLKLLEEKIINERLIEKVKSSNSMEELFRILLDLPTVGSFLAYQFAIDINYSELVNFSEMDFVVPGPGAKDGIRKCFTDLGDFNETDIIKYVTDIQEDEFIRLELNFKNLWGRRLQLIDCQNLFCETDKYSRVAHPEISGISNRKRIKQIYKPKTTEIRLFYPPKWNINHIVDLSLKTEG